jgi:N6-adenosine-specific RNA methylase IME4
MTSYFSLPEGTKFDIIYADPPWQYTKSVLHGAACKHYDLMSLEELCKMPVKDIASNSCALLMWTTGPMFGQALKLIQAWGFKYKTVFLVWNKLYKRKLTTVTGTGWYTKPSCEFLLIGMRGKLKDVKKVNANVKQLLATARDEHSVKPDEARTCIHEFFKDDLNKIELFARCKVNGWSVWGNETDKYKPK